MQVIQKNDRGEFNIMIFLAVLITAMWLRFILMLQLTFSFGPMLRIIIVMITDVTKFFMIEAVILLCLTSVSALIFGSVDSYSSFTGVFFLMFDSGLANYDLTVFSELTIGEEYGQVFIIFIVIINAIIMLNFIIAILADTYSKYSTQSLGLYYDGIIQRIPVYEDDSRYGGLIIGSPPFNVAAVILVPFYCCNKDERRLQSCNDTFSKLVYAPIALVFSILFALMNLVLLPFAYLAAIYHKVALLCALSKKKAKSGKKSKSKDKKAKRTTDQVLIDLFVFIVFGVPILVLA